MIRNESERETLTARAEVIARLLPGNFRVNHLTKNTHRIEIKDDKHRYFTIDPSVYGNNNKLRITCGARWANHSINCSPDRSNEAIAGDIERRLLPDFYLAWKSHHDNEAENQRRASTLSLHKQTLNRITPVRSSHNNGWWINNAEIRPPYDPDNPASYNLYNINASCSFDQLIRIVAILNESKK